MLKCHSMSQKYKATRCPDGSFVGFVLCFVGASFTSSVVIQCGENQTGLKRLKCTTGGQLLYI